MKPSDILRLIQGATGKEATASPETHLPLHLHLQRFMVPPHDGNPRYHLEEGKIVALNLAGMNLRDDQIGFLDQLHDLQALNLSDNFLTEFRVSANLSKLVCLELSDHAGEEGEEKRALKKVIFEAALPNLERLNLSHTGLEELSFQEGLASLQIVELQKNKLTKIELPAGFNSLRFIDLKDNIISDFQATGIFPDLYTLYLENNKLTEIHQDFLGPFPNLGRLRLEGNPLHESVLANISENSTATLDAIKRYTADLEGGTDIDRECKVLLLGNGSVGKSTLVNRMVHDEFLEDWDSTHGISLEQYPNPAKETPGEKLIDPYILNLWDFGGQDIYHATHRLFMQSNALYLLLWSKKNLKEEKTYIIEDGEERVYENRSMEYWLSYAVSQGNQSPALLVQTRSGTGLSDKEKLPEIDAAFHDKFPRLAFEHVESQSNDWSQNGYEDLLEEVKKAVKGIKGKVEIPESWLEIRKQVRAMQKEQVKRLELQDFYAISEKVEEPLDVLRWLTQSGALFYKEGLFNDEIILDQAWAIEAIYTLFDRKKFYYKALRGSEGKFSGADLKQIWKTDKKASSEAEMELFVSFMLSCEMCFETTPEDKERYHVPFAERTFIAPQLLPPKTASQDLIWKDKQALIIRFEHKFLHYGVIQSFIVRAQKLGTVLGMWKTGILLEQGEELIQVEAWEKRVEIKASVKSPKLLSVISKQLRELQDNQALESVSLDGENFVSHKKLEEQIQRGKNQEVECTSGGFVEIAPFLPYFQKLYGLKSERGGMEEMLVPERELLEEPLKKVKRKFEMPETELPKVYFSYAWGDSHETGKSREELVDALYDSLIKDKGNYKLFRDKKNIEFGDMISEFMKELGEGDLVVVFVSDKYLRSEYCMHELCEVGRNNKFDQKLFTKHVLPIRVEGELRLNDPTVLDIYFDYWEEERKKWVNFVNKRTERGNLSSSQSDRLVMIQNIERNFGDLSDWLIDINSSTHALLSQNDYQLVKTAIEKRLNENH